MNKREFLFLTVICIILAAALFMPVILAPGVSLAEPTGEITDEVTDGCRGILTEDQIVVYYFHRKFRCPSCLIVESTLHETMEKYFSQEFRDGRLALCFVNIDDGENRHYLDEYDLLFNSVIVVEKRAGKAERFKNIDRIWEIYSDREATIQLLQREIRPFLAGG
jgi:hypothetical protein